MPLYILGFKGMTRRLNHYDNPEWQPYLVVALLGACFVALGIWFILQQVFVSIRDRKQNLDITGDPWGGRTLEWSIPSPAPFYNFAHVPRVDHLDQHWENKENRSEEHTSELQSLMRISYAVFCLTKKTTIITSTHNN